MLITNEKCFLSRIHTLEFCVCVLYCLFMCFFLFELSFPIFVMVFQISLFVLCFGQLYHFTKCASIENTVAQGRIEECNQKLDSADAYADCSSLIGTNWNCVNSAPSRVGEDIHREQVRMSCGENEQGPLVCCPVWGLIRCMLTQVKNHCNPQFGDAFSNEYREDAFQPAIDQLNEQYCAEYPFASNQCDYVLQFIRDTRVLESQAHLSGLYQFFFSNVTSKNRLAHFRAGKSSIQQATSQLWFLTFTILLSSLLACFPMYHI